MSDSRDQAGDAVLLALAAVRQVRPPVDLADRIGEAVRATPQDRRLVGTWSFRLVAAAAMTTLVVGSFAVGGAWRDPEGEPSIPATVSPSLPSAAPLTSATTSSGPPSDLGTVARANAEFSIGEGLAVEPGQLVLILPGLVDHEGQPSYRISTMGISTPATGRTATPAGSRWFRLGVFWTSDRHAAQKADRISPISHGSSPSNARSASDRRT